MNESEIGGFVIEPRNIIRCEWYTDVVTMHLYRHCRLRANFESTKWRGIELERGQFITSLKTLSAETGLSVMQVRTALAKLEKSGYIANKSTNKNRIITVLFYSDEQAGNKQVSSQITTDNKRNKIEKRVEQSPTTYPEEIKAVVACLNDAAGTSFRSGSKETRRLITARLNEGYTVEDFRRVIDSKVTEWRGTEFERYLRPGTLFGTKFESYLNAAKAPRQDEMQRLLEGYNR